MKNSVVTVTNGQILELQANAKGFKVAFYLIIDSIKHKNRDSVNGY